MLADPLSQSLLLFIPEMLPHGGTLIFSGATMAIRTFTIPVDHFTALTSRRRSETLSLCPIGIR